jgi:hypothetical protein
LRRWRWRRWRCRRCGLYAVQRRFCPTNPLAQRAQPPGLVRLRAVSSWGSRASFIALHLAGELVQLSGHSLALGHGRVVLGERLVGVDPGSGKQLLGPRRVFVRLHPRTSYRIRDAHEVCPFPLRKRLKLANPLLPPGYLLAELVGSFEHQPSFYVVKRQHPCTPAAAAQRQMGRWRQ